MKINIQSSILLESKALTQSITKKIRAFGKDFKAISEVDVKLKQDIATGNKTTEIYLKTTGKNIYAIQGGRNFDLATDKAVLKLREQLNKNVVSAPAETESSEPNSEIKTETETGTNQSAEDSQEEE